MIGRGAICNPWIFDQIRQHLRGEAVFEPTPADRMRYLGELWEAVTDFGTRELDQVNRIKKHLNFFGPVVSESALFLHEMRRCTEKAALFEVCSRHFATPQSRRD